MWVPKSTPSSTLIPALVKKLKVMIYVGDQDYMCNSLGLNRSISEMEWNGQKGFGLDDQGRPILPKDYYVNGTKQGSWTEARGLSFVKYDHASHLVPADAPHAVHDMVLRFMGVDPLLAAGPVSSLASQVGAEDHTGIIVKTHPNGTLLEQDKLNKELDKAPSIGAAPVLETIEERQAYYGPRQTIALIIVLTGLIVGLVMLFKWRRKRRRAGRHLSKDKGRAICMERRSRGSYSNRSRPLGGSPGAKRPHRARKNDEENQALVLSEQASSSHGPTSLSRRGSLLSEPPSHFLTHSQIFSLQDEDDDDDDPRLETR